MFHGERQFPGIRCDQHLLISRLEEIGTGFDGVVGCGQCDDVHPRLGEQTVHAYLLVLHLPEGGCIECALVADYGYDPFERIENFILKEVIPKYECLTTVHRSYFDECGFPGIEFYIRYNVKLSFEQNQKLYMLAHAPCLQ